MSITAKVPKSVAAEVNRMTKLLKQYELESDEDYFEMVLTSAVNGQYTQAAMQFNAMPKGYQKDMIKILVSTNNYGIGGDYATYFIDII